MPCLIIAEKQMAAQRIAEILSNGKAVQKNLFGANFLEFEKNNETFFVVPLRGHIVEIDFPKHLAYWSGTELSRLLEAEIVVMETEKKIADLLRKIGKDCNCIIIATDADREGEGIGVEALRFVLEKNPKIETRRMIFSAMTPKDIQSAFQNQTQIDFALADSSEARREIDLVWGAVLTRFLSIAANRLGKEFLSVGRVQTPVLAIIVNREKKILSFNPKDYWEISAELEKNKQVFLAEHSSGKIFEKEKAQTAFENSKNEKKALIEKIKSKKIIIKKPVPFNTTDFLRASTAIGFSANEAMNIAEELYQKGFISYPRTDNQVYPKNLDIKEILLELQKIPEFSGLAQKILAMNKIEASSGKETKDHPPVHPVSACQKNSVGEKYWKIYELVSRRFLATLAENCETKNLTVEILIGKEKFLSHGQTIQKLGWKEFYPYSQISEIILPELKEKEEVRVKKISMDAKKTAPPQRLSQGALIKLMEKFGLGTKSTRAEIIQKLYYRQYISGAKIIQPNSISFAVVSALESHAPKVTQSEMTSELEKEMDLIANSQKTKQDVCNDSKKMLGLILQQLTQNKFAISKDLRTALTADSIIGKCNKCNEGTLVMLRGKTNKRFAGCSNYPKCSNSFPLPQKGKLIALEQKCPECNLPIIRLAAKRGFQFCMNPNCPAKTKPKEQKTEPIIPTITKK